MRNIFVLLLLLVGFYAEAQVKMVKAGAGEFSLVGKKRAATVYYDSSDPVLTYKVSDLFAQDVERVTGRQLMVKDIRMDKTSVDEAVIVGTVNSDIIKLLAKRGKIGISDLAGTWERYRIQLVKSPVRGIGKAIVIVGSDRRGAAYGLLSVSEAIGVNPWYFWMDAPVTHHDYLGLNVTPYTSNAPSVKYRGIFINDEDWGLLRWVKNNFEKDRGNFGPKTYAKVCELLLRLKANYLCPAMHERSTPFYKVPENKLVADSFGIVMGTSHCEPLFLNTASEWNTKKYGEWNYETNRRRIDSVLRARTEITAPYEGVYTLALRGLHDVAMAGSNDLTERKNVMQKALEAQRQIVSDVLGKRPQDIPQAFTPYKEVLDVYDHGLKLPDDVTIIWPDDNYGYMKRLSSPTEQKRSGRSGVYYHSSYLGRPHNYLWMNTTSPTLMYEELRKAFDTTADRIWLLNAGDIKLCEFAVDFFLSMAYDINSFNYNRAAHYRTEWTCNMLGSKYKKELDDIFLSFYNLAFQRKPECMGFGSQWTNRAYEREINVDTEFSLTNYREADRRIAEYIRIGSKAAEIYSKLPDSYKACFYEGVYYPVKGCELLNRTILYGQRNRWYAMQNRAATNKLAKESEICYDSLEAITKYYNSMLGGKWNHIVALRQENSSAYFDRPELRKANLEANADMVLNVEQEDVLIGRSSYHLLPAFNKYLKQVYYIDLFNKGQKAFQWKAATSESWIHLSKLSGTAFDEQRVYVSIDWDKVPSGDRVAGTIDVKADNGQNERALVSVFNPMKPSIEDVDSAFIENNGYVSIPATKYYRKVDNKNFRISIIPNIGAEGESVQLGNPVAPQWYTNNLDAPYVEYKFYSFSQGAVDVYTYVLPTFTLNNDRGYAGHERTNIETHYGVMIDKDTRILEASTSSFEYAQSWYDSVMRNCRINKTTLNVMSPGWHTLRIIGGDGGTVLQKIVIDFGGLKRSYMGPQSTQVSSR